MSCIECGNKKTVPRRKICYQCRYKRSKISQPIHLAYYSLKYHAKERNKEFSLTFEQFEQFCVKTNYISKKGIKKNSYHVDRIIETEGYNIGNIQLLTNSDNIRKYIKFVRINEFNKKEFTVETVNYKIEITAPF